MTPNVTCPLPIPSPWAFPMREHQHFHDVCGQDHMINDHGFTRGGRARPRWSTGRSAGRGGGFDHSRLETTGAGGKYPAPTPRGLLASRA